MLLFEFDGKIIRGKGIGRTFGFPTANLSISHAMNLPYGVYAARVFIRGQWLDSLVNVGRHPTVPDGPPSIEAHIVGFSNDIYGERITLRLTRFVREERKFASIEALREQIQKDLHSLASDPASAPEAAQVPSANHKATKA